MGIRGPQSRNLPDQTPAQQPLTLLVSGYYYSVLFMGWGVALFISWWWNIHFSAHIKKKKKKIPCPCHGYLTYGPCTEILLRLENSTHPFQPYFVCLGLSHYHFICISILHFPANSWTMRNWKFCHVGDSLHYAIPSIDLINKTRNPLLQTENVLLGSQKLGLPCTWITRTN